MVRKPKPRPRAKRRGKAAVVRRRRLHDAHVLAWQFYSQFGDRYLERLSAKGGILGRFAAKGVMIEDLVRLDADFRGETVEAELRRVPAGAEKRFRRVADDLRALPKQMRPAHLRSGAVSTEWSVRTEDGITAEQIAASLYDCARWLETLRRGLSGKQGRPPAAMKREFMAAWKRLAIARAKTPLHGLGAVAFNATFDANETADSFKNRVLRRLERV